MSATRQARNPKTLKRRWQERCRQGNFSPAVLGIGTIRVFGRSGDAPVTFPRVESLASLTALEADERWAIEVAQEMINAAQADHRAVVATQPPQVGAVPNPTPLRTFDPKTGEILILSLTRGG